MAVYEENSAQIAVAGFGDRIGRSVSIMINRIQEWKDARATRTLLSSLSDAELNDIGLSRADIDRIARQPNF
ncbi:DUF1127 domain-containing protein [Phaeobacter sp. J2-8]|uniref:DUF1127 domain-containing protein n=1 Tax=Phaeobacter sp. J2-8 TaxID=2931394 RepID=UPI001FD0E02A|nr:DUF1127 domain-containing protein [Phaeobacter sp. J2-8]MCJ7872991.1 DUF1127 domain-containing protein [Phaeobacter sp. J2-8]